jgi:ABC-2 type transport system ATP-binding protein
MTDPALVVRGVSRRFGDHQVLDDVSLAVPVGGVHALIGPNGAGKTTLLRMVCGLVDPDPGTIHVMGRRVGARGVDARRHVGFVPSGDRTFYLRLSGLENLEFYGRLYGLRRRAARERAHATIAAVDLVDAARRPVGTYSHGMHKRLSVARALLARPDVLIVDEATHDLDPANARLVQDLVSRSAAEGAAVVWATQRLEELRGFADEVTVLVAGRARFRGTVHDLAARALVRRYVVRLRSAEAVREAATALPPGATATPAAELGAEHALLVLAPGQILGHALAQLTRRGIDVLSCTEERSPVEQAFMDLSDEPKVQDTGVSQEVSGERPPLNGAEVRR